MNDDKLSRLEVNDVTAAVQQLLQRILTDLKESATKQKADEPRLFFPAWHRADQPSGEDRSGQRRSYDCWREWSEAHRTAASPGSPSTRRLPHGCLG